MAYPQQTFLHTTFAPSSFLARKRSVVFTNTIPYQLSVLRACGTYDAFRLRWRDSYRRDPLSWIPPDFHLFWDSDLAKWIEGACYALADWRARRNAAGGEGGKVGEVEEEERGWREVEEAVVEVVDMMARAQMEDGYLNIHYQVVEPEARFTNLRDMHELYNAGHLIEAALAHEHHFQDGKMLSVLLKYVDLLHATFGPGAGQIHGYSGHPEIELALMRLHSVTGDAKHLELGAYFITERGRRRRQGGGEGRDEEKEEHFYDWEARRRGEKAYERPNHYPAWRDYWYQQASKPISEQDKVEGHAVRAMYLYAGVADYQRKEGGNGARYGEVLARLWQNMVGRRMYVTGGIGAMHQWEGFGIDYFLPQSVEEGGCYAETCAGIGVMMFAHRMLQIELDSHYADIMELAFYNAVLGGMSSDGKKFSYENALASCDSTPCRREKWFTCACCPPNVTRLLGSIGGYVWDWSVGREEEGGGGGGGGGGGWRQEQGKKAVVVNVHMFASASLRFKVEDEEDEDEGEGRGEIVVTQALDTPDQAWGSCVRFTVQAPKSVSLALRVRIPAWADGWKMTPEASRARVERGYLTLEPEWAAGQVSFELSLTTKIRVQSPHPYTNQHTVTLSRGPLIYCLEDVDNSWERNHFKDLLFDHKKAELTEEERCDDETGESYVAIVAKGGISFLDTEEMASTRDEVEKLVFVPFYYRANRTGRGHMRVGLRKA